MQGIAESAGSVQHVAVIDPGMDNDAERGPSPVEQTKAIGAELLQVSFARQPCDRTISRGLQLASPPRPR
jgi:hypothetical protein